MPFEVQFCSVFLFAIIGIAANVVPAYAVPEFQYVDKHGKSCFSLKFRYASSFHSGTAIVELMKNDSNTLGSEKRFGMLDHNGKFKELQAASVRNMTPDGMAVFLEKEDSRRDGYFDNAGNITISPQFTFAADFSEGVAVVRRESSRPNELIDRNGTTKFTFPQSVKPFDHIMSEGLLRVEFADKENRTGFIDSNGHIVIPPLPNKFSCGDFKNGMALLVHKWGPYSKSFGFIDKKGNQLVLPVYDFASEFSEGVAAVCKSGKWSYIDKNGQAVIDLPTDCSWAGKFSEGKAIIQVAANQVAIIDRAGTIVPIEESLLYCKNSYFSEGLSVICKKNQSDVLYGYVDPQGKIVIAPQYSNASPFSEGLAFVQDQESRNFSTMDWKAAGLSTLTNYPSRYDQWLKFIEQYKLIGMTTERLHVLLGAPSPLSGDKHTCSYWLYSRDDHLNSGYVEIQILNGKVRRFREHNGMNSGSWIEKNPDSP